MQPDMDRDAEAKEHARRRQQRAERVQKRRMALGIIALSIIVLVVALVWGLSGRGGGTTSSSSTTSSTNPLESANYSAKLTGADSVPKVSTPATGEFTLKYDSAKKQLSYGLDITKAITKPNAAAIYEGKPGSSGAVVYTLAITAANASTGVFTVGTLSEGVVKEPDLVGPLQGKTIADLIKLIVDGNAYVSVGTPTHPIDAIRGQIIP
jgi:CHRD domain